MANIKKQQMNWETLHDDTRIGKHAQNNNGEVGEIDLLSNGQEYIHITFPDGTGDGAPAGKLTILDAEDR